MSLHKRFFSSLFFIALCSAAFGQAAQTPFSTFGVGEPYGNSLIQNQGMGGIGVSHPQFWSINNQNPALLVYNYYTSFQAGALLESRKLTSDSVSQKGVYGNMNYLVVAFPVKRGKWTTSFGLMPYTNVNYKMVYLDYVTDLDNPSGPPADTVGIVEQGSGGLSQFYWANGIKIYKDLSLGIKATYLFGSTNRDYSNLLDNDYTIPGAIPYIIGIKEQTYVKDFMFSGGLSYSKDSIGRKQDYRLSAGLVYAFGTDLKATNTTVFQRRFTDNSPVSSDTIVTKRGIISIPSSVTVGISAAKGTKWMAGAEFSVQDWSQFKSVNKEDEGLEKSWKASAGGEFTPNPSSSNYLKRVTYRAGFSYEKNPFSVNGTQLTDVGINFGLTCPTGFSSLDFAFRAGKRGDKAETGLEESYYKIFFGISYNDRWFIKRRFD